MRTTQSVEPRHSHAERGNERKTSKQSTANPLSPGVHDLVPTLRVGTHSPDAPRRSPPRHSCSPPTGFLAITFWRRAETSIALECPTLMFTCNEATAMSRIRVVAILAVTVFLISIAGMAAEPPAGATRGHTLQPSCWSATVSLLMRSRRTSNSQ